jgi:hypothetical protein
VEQNFSISLSPLMLGFVVLLVLAATPILALSRFWLGHEGPVSGKEKKIDFPLCERLPTTSRLDGTIRTEPTWITSALPTSRY